MRGRPGQIRVDGDEISGDGGNYQDGAVDIRGGVITRVHKNGLSFVDRGDPDAWDFTLSDFTTDGSYHEFDLSSIVPVQAKAVLLQSYIKDDAAGSYFNVRAKGNSNNRNSAFIYTQVANVAITADLITPINEGKLEYRGSSVTFTNINVVVKGWWQ